MRTGRVGPRAWLLAAALVATGAWAEGGRPFEECAAGVDAEPESLEAWRCYWRLGRRLSRPEAALEAIGERIELFGGDPRGELYRGMLYGDLGDPRAPDSWRRASAGCERLGDWTCVTYTRLALAFHHRYEPESARPELERALAAALRSGDPVLAARARIGAGWRAVFDERYGPARAAFLAAKESLGESGPFDARDSVLNGLGYVAWATGRFEEATRLYRAEAELARSAPDPYLEATALFNALYLEGLARRERDPDHRLSIGELEETLTAVLAVGNPELEAKTRLLLVASELAPERALAELDAARRAARSAGATEELAAADRLEAVELARSGRLGEALARLERGIRIAREGRVREEILRGELQAPILLWRAGERSEAIVRARRAVAGVERLLSSQPLARDRAGLELHWIDAAYALARLLADAGELDLAIEILERMRNRSVLAGLAGAADGVVGGELAGLRAEIEEVQALLLRAGEDEARRSELLAELERLELREEATLARLGAGSPEPGRPPPTLSRLQASLPRDQALLSFQVPVFADPEEPFGGSWLLAIGRDSAHVLELPDPAALRRAVAAVDGLLGRDDAPARRARARLHGQLLAPALAALGPSVRRLVLIPDGALHRLAFAALVAGENEPPLGASHELERSGALAGWLAATDRSRPSSPATALVLADPDLSAGPRSGLAASRAGLLDAAGLGRLDGARREARQLARIFGENGRVLVGAGATEAELKRSDLGGVGLLHFAAHAVVDDRRPYRSAILLAPGGGEDGLLQMRDIVELQLGGTIVVLASCRSAEGERFAGEGVFSLARAFLDAGASAVVANLRALDDEESSRFLEPMFRALGDGLPLRSALAAARRGAPRAARGAAWSTAILLGDGGARLDVEEEPQRSVPAGLALGATAVLLLLLLTVAVRGAWRKLGGLLLLGALTSVPAGATTYFVDRGHPAASDANPGTEALPWLTIQHAAEVLAAGDAVLVKSGTYPERVVPQGSGAPSAPILYSAYPGHVVTIDGAGIVLAPFEALVEIANVSDVRFTGFRVRNAGPRTTSVGIGIFDATRVRVERCHVSKTASSGIQSWGSADVTIAGNEVTEALTAGASSENEVITIGETSGFEVRDNHVWNPGAVRGEGIDAKDGSSNGTVHHNHVHDTRGVGIYVDAWDKPTHDITVHSNLVHDVDGDGLAAASEMGGSLSNVRFHDNVVWGNRWLGFGVSNCCIASHPISNLVVDHNTFVDNGWPGGWGGGIDLDNDQATGVVLRNNVVSENLSFQIAIESGTGTVDHNLIHGFRGYPGETLGTNAVVGDPLFVDRAGRDFRLRFGSPGRDAASSADNPPADFDGNPRPWGPAPDLGAFERGQRIFADGFESGTARRGWSASP